MSNQHNISYSGLSFECSRTGNKAECLMWKKPDKKVTGTGKTIDEAKYMAWRKLNGLS